MREGVGITWTTTAVRAATANSLQERGPRVRGHGAQRTAGVRLLDVHHIHVPHGGDRGFWHRLALVSCVATESAVIGEQSMSPTSERWDRTYPIMSASPLGLGVVAMQLLQRRETHDAEAEVASSKP